MDSEEAEGGGGWRHQEPHLRSGQAIFGLAQGLVLPRVLGGLGECGEGLGGVLGVLGGYWARGSPLRALGKTVQGGLGSAW